MGYLQTQRKRRLATANGLRAPDGADSLPRLTGRRQLIGLGIGLAIATLVVFSRSFDFDFIRFDDPGYVFEKRHVSTGLSFENVRWAFTTGEQANWHPLTWLSLQLDASLQGGPKPGGFHATNVLLHAVNSALLFWVLAQMTGAVWRSLMVGALLALHPLHVESVAWVSERKDVLSSLFWMLTMAAYLAYARRPGVLRYLTVFGCLAFGLMAKPMLITLPFVLLLLDYWPLMRLHQFASSSANESTLPEERGWRVIAWRLVLEKLPLFALAAASCAITYVVQAKGHAVGTLERYPFPSRLENAIVSYAAYLRQMVWPLTLSVFYRHPGTAIPLENVLAAGFFLTAVTWLVFWAGRRHPYLAVGWLWFLGTLVPVIGIVQVGEQARADRYTYIPLIGCFLMLVWGVSDLAQVRHWPRQWLIWPAAALTSTCAVLTWMQLGYWQDEYSLWQHAIRIDSQNAKAHQRLGMEYYRRDDLDKSGIEYRLAIAIDPKCAAAYIGLGNNFVQLGRPEEAIAEYRQAVALLPATAFIHHNLASALLGEGFLAEAEAEFRQTIACDPETASAYLGLGRALYQMGKKEGALKEFRAAIALEPTLAQAHVAFGEALFDLGMFAEAEYCLRKGLELLPPKQSLPSRAVVRYQSLPFWRSLEQRLPKLLDANDRSDLLGTAWLCQLSRVARYTSAVELYSAAFAANPALAGDGRNELRRIAARAALKARTNLDKDRSPTSQADQTRMRSLALEWMLADLAFWKKEIQSAQAKERGAARAVLYGWQFDPEYAVIREQAELAKLPEPEQSNWRQFWNEVASTLDSKSGSGK